MNEQISNQHCAMCTIPVIGLFAQLSVESKTPEPGFSHQRRARLNQHFLQGQVQKVQVHTNCDSFMAAILKHLHIMQPSLLQVLCFNFIYCDKKQGRL